jgi:phage terminase small subunit
MTTKKTPNRRQRRNSRDIGLVAVAGGAVEVPPALGKWLASTKRRWGTYWASDVAGIVDVKSDLPALERLFSHYDELERGQRVFRRQRFVAGHRGQPRLNPLAKYLADLESAARALEDRFGLTPKARLQLGVEFGAAHRSLASISQEFDADTQPDPRLGHE